MTDIFNIEPQRRRDRGAAGQSGIRNPESVLLRHHHLLSIISYLSSIICGCRRDRHGSSRTSILVAVLVILVAVFAVMLVRSLKPKPAPEPVPLSAREQTKRMIEERTADPVYMAGLKRYQEEQADIARRREAVAAEHRAWLKGFSESNEAAKALFERREAAHKAGEPYGTFEEELEEIEKADPEGAALIARREALDDEARQKQQEIKAYIGDRVRRQAMEHSAEERAAAVAFRKAHPEKAPASFTNGVAVGPSDEWRAKVRERLGITNAATASPQMIDNR